MALCYGCHIHVASFPLDHVHLWEEKFTKEETDYVNELHNKGLTRKRDIATEENYKRLKLMLVKYTGKI